MSGMSDNGITPAHLQESAYHEQPSGEKNERQSDVNEGETSNLSHPRAHYKTFLALFAICLTYFAQSYALIGTGSVSGYPPIIVLESNGSGVQHFR